MKTVTNEDGYTVYEDGTIISPSGKKIKPSRTKKGYLICRLKVGTEWKTLFHHRYVLEAFNGKTPEGLEVHHIDGVRDNNHLNNLKAVTPSENNQDSYDSGRRVVKGSKNANAKIGDEDVMAICKRLVSNPKLNVSALSREIGISRETISAIKNRKQWTHISYKYDF